MSKTDESLPANFDRSEAEKTPQDLAKTTFELIVLTTGVLHSQKFPFGIDQSKIGFSFEELNQQLVELFDYPIDLSQLNLNKIEIDQDQILDDWQKAAESFQNTYISTKENYSPSQQKKFDAILDKIDNIAQHLLSKPELKAYSLLFVVSLFLWFSQAAIQGIVYKQYQADGFSELYNFFQQTLGDQTAEFIIGQLGILGEPVALGMAYNRLRGKQKSREQIINDIGLVSTLLLLHEMLTFVHSSSFRPDVKDVLVLCIPVLTTQIFQRIKDLNQKQVDK